MKRPGKRQAPQPQQPVVGIGLLILLKSRKPPSSLVRLLLLSQPSEASMAPREGHCSDPHHPPQQSRADPAASGRCVLRASTAGFVRRLPVSFSSLAAWRRGHQDLPQIRLAKSISIVSQVFIFVESLVDDKHLPPQHRCSGL